MDTETSSWPLADDDRNARATGVAERLIAVTLGDCATQQRWTNVRRMAWPELAMLLTTHAHGSKEGACLVPATFRSQQRRNNDAARIDVVLLDSDSGAPLAEICRAISARGWCATIASTHSHLGSHTKAKRGAYEAWCQQQGLDPADATSPERFLIDSRGMRPDVASGAHVASQDNEQIIFAHQPCPRFRIALPLARPWSADAYDTQQMAIAAWRAAYTALATALGLQHDASCTDTARLFYLPRYPLGGPKPETALLDGDWVDILALQAAAAATSTETSPTRRLQAQRHGANCRPFGAERSSSTNRTDISYTDPETGEAISLRRWAATQGHRFLIATALRSRSPHVLRPRFAEQRRQHISCPNAAAHTSPDPDDATFVCDAGQGEGTSGFVIHCRHAHCTDHDRLAFLRQMLEQRWLHIEDLTSPEFQADALGQDEPWPDEALTEHKVAEHFARRAADHLRYCHTRGAWFVWSGHHWQQNHTRLAFHWMRRMTAKLNAKATGKTLVATSKASFITAVERFAQSDPALAVTDPSWNTDPWLLATPGGTVDLRSGVLRPAQQCDMISRLTVVAPADEPDCPQWLAFLHQATNGDAELIAFIQRWLGYCLTGVTREHALLFVYGPGGNGKGVLLMTMSGMLGTYAVTAALDTFTAAHGERHSTDVAMLAGARFVMTTETEEGRAWAEARIKALTGGDSVTARFMRQDNFTFMPAFKLTISGNHKPTLRNVDDAARRRFNVVPFLHKPAMPDKELPEKLKSEWPGILRWMIDGCLAWQRDGLRPPAAVTEATAEYFAEQDMLAQWLEECCEIGSGFSATSKDLFGSWRGFAADRGEDVRSAKWFGTMLEKHSFKRAKDCVGLRGRGYAGLRLIPPPAQPHFQERD